MSIPAALVLAVRTQHHEMLNDFDDKKRERAFKKQYGDQWFEMMYGKQSVTPEDNLLKVTESFSKQWRTMRKQLTEQEVEFVKTAPAQEIMLKYNISERTAYNWQRYAKGE
jgi:hypothetical protein